jgi:thiamine-monophosphate kinase
MPGEFELIERLCAGITLSKRTILGPGDDCAIIASRRSRMLVTIDSMVEGVHFRLGWGTPRELGRRALAVNLSDIAAMGGVPAFCVINLAVRRGIDAAFFDNMYRGLKAAARAAGVDVVGGNITRADQLAITIALLGDLPGAALRRDSARAGDEIFVTGTVGDAAAGLRILQGKLHAPVRARSFLVSRFLNPAARLDAGRALARIRPAPAAIDLSDGLLQDLGHIVERSGVGAEIDAQAVPLSPAYRAALGDDPSLALGGGEDYELLFCTSAGHRERDLARRLGLPVTRIGKIVKGRSVTVIGNRGASGGMRGFDQLRSRD